MAVLSAVTVGQVSIRSRDLTWQIAFAGLCAVMLVPLVVVDVPPLLDYPNHLARVFVLASLPGDPVLARFYAPHWSIIPNLALDLMGPPLLRVLPVHVAGRLLIAAGVLLPVCGTILYHLSLGSTRGGRWWSLCVGLSAYNSTLLFGFLNFTISLGVALLLAAGWLRWRENRSIAAIGLAMAGAPVLFFCHLMGLLFFAVLIGSAELYRLPRVANGHLVRCAIRRGLVLILVFAMPLGLYAASDLHPLGGDSAFVGLDVKLSQLVSVFSNYDVTLDVAAVLLVTAVPVVSIVLRRGAMPGPAAIATIALIMLYFAAPSAWKGTYSLDLRFGVMLVFMVFAGFAPDGWPRSLRVGVMSVLVLLMLARMSLLTMAWAAHNADVADLRRVLASVQPGQTVYVAAASVEEAPGYWRSNPGWRRLSGGSRLDDHIGALVLIERRAYWPFEFDNPSQQPIETLEPYRSLAERVGHLPNWGEAAAADLCGFDYVLLLEADSVPDLPAKRFRVLARSGYAALYSVTRCKPDA